MEKTTLERFRVVEPGESIWNGSTNHTHIWFEVLTGDDMGIRVGVPLFASRYSAEMEERVQSLNEGDIVEAVLQREDSSDTWRPTKIEKVS